MVIQPINGEIRARVDEILKEEWGCPPCVSRGRMIDTTRLPGFVFVESGAVLGVITYEIMENECEITTLNSLRENTGIGTALINTVLEIAKDRGCKRLWLITTNDDINAIKFYQKRGFDLIAAHINAMDHSRKLKPSIPLIGMNDIPIKHELEFEIKL